MNIYLVWTLGNSPNIYTNKKAVVMACEHKLWLAHLPHYSKPEIFEEEYQAREFAEQNQHMTGVRVEERAAVELIKELYAELDSAHEDIEAMNDHGYDW